MPCVTISPSLHPPFTLPCSARGCLGTSAVPQGSPTSGILGIFPIVFLAPLLPPSKNTNKPFPSPKHLRKLSTELILAILILVRSVGREGDALSILHADTSFNHVQYVYSTALMESSLASYQTLDCGVKPLQHFALTPHHPPSKSKSGEAFQTIHLALTQTNFPPRDLPPITSPSRGVISLPSFSYLPSSMNPRVSIAARHTYSGSDPPLAQ